MSKHANYQEMADVLRDIQQEMLELLNHAKRLLSDAPNSTRQRAEAYWLAHATMALTNDHGYLGGSMVSMDDSIEEIETAADEDETEDAEA